MYVDKYDPSVPQETKSIYAKRTFEKDHPPNQPTIDFKYYEKGKGRKQQPHLEQSSYYPVLNYNGLNTPYPFINTQLPFAPPIIKNIVVGDVGPTGDHGILKSIFEDVLPTKNALGTFMTLDERLKLFTFIRAVMFANVDGQDVEYSKGISNLYNRLKVSSINPYVSRKYSQNPYYGLPDGYMIYNSCYPIRKDESGMTSCAKDSISLNIRLYFIHNKIYKLFIGESEYKNTRPFHTEKELLLLGRDDEIKERKRRDDAEAKLKRDFDDARAANRPLLEAPLIPRLANIKVPDPESDVLRYDEFRDVVFYEHIRENILKKKRSPNFLNLYGYSFSGHLKIDFKGASSLNRLSEMQRYNLERIDTDFRKIPRKKFEEIKEKSNQMGIELKKYFNDIFGGVYETGKSRNDKVLIVLTEAPTQRLTSWASIDYQDEQNVIKMINTGTHTVIEWKVVFFEILYALYNLVQDEIVIRDFSLEDNIFVKDISKVGSRQNYWKYTVNGFDFYIPNLGFVVVIDSNFRSINYDDYDTIVTMIKDNESGKKKKKSSNPFTPIDFYKDISEPPKINKLDGKPFHSSGYDIFTYKYNPFNDAKNAVKPGAELTKINKDFDDIAIKRGEYLDMFLKVFESTSLGKDFLNNNGVEPPEDILEMKGVIYNYFRYLTDKENDNDFNRQIKYYGSKDLLLRAIREMMLYCGGEFLNNRIGTPVTNADQIVPEVFNGNDLNSSIGNIFLYQDPLEPQVYKFTILSENKKETSDDLDIAFDNLLLGRLNNYEERYKKNHTICKYSVGDNCRIITNLNESKIGGIEYKDCSKDDLHTYRGKLYQDRKPLRKKITEEELIETYVV
jgi:hypothetical protein